MDKKHLHTLVAGMHDRALEQAAAVAAAPRAARNRNTELGAAQATRVHRKSQVGHGNQLQATVEDAQQL
ncbi:hypothetical protein RZS08_30955, partial [Arthrospira platensis SPKY1]|nr:hypothetical protein [Arthrospira platensis SPKY1]